MSKNMRLVVYGCYFLIHVLTYFLKMHRRYREQSGKEESICLEGDIGGGLVLQRQISICKENPKIVKIDSSIRAKQGADHSGGFSG